MDVVQEKGKNMTDKMTRKEALETALEVMSDWLTDWDGTGEQLTTTHTEKAMGVIRNMIAQMDKQATRPKGKTTARKQNEQFAVLFIAAVKAASKPVNAKWIAEHVNGVMTSQRAVHVAKIALEWGAIQEVEIKKRKYYTCVDTWEPNEEFKEIAAKLRR